jgi:hypothetical protein
MRVESFGDIPFFFWREGLSRDFESRSAIVLVIPVGAHIHIGREVRSRQTSRDGIHMSGIPTDMSFERWIIRDS